MGPHPQTWILLIAIVLVTLAAVLIMEGARGEEPPLKGGFDYYGPYHVDTDQSRVPLPQANPLKQKKHKRLKHPRCDPDTGRCRWTK